jgi:hypothetical protein
MSRCRASAVVGLRNAMGGVPEETVGASPAESVTVGSKPSRRSEKRVRFTLDLERDHIASSSDSRWIPKSTPLGS